MAMDGQPHAQSTVGIWSRRVGQVGRPSQNAPVRPRHKDCFALPLVIGRVHPQVTTGLWSAAQPKGPQNFVSYDSGQKDGRRPNQTKSNNYKMLVVSKLTYTQYASQALTLSSCRPSCRARVILLTVNTAAEANAHGCRGERSRAVLPTYFKHCQ